MPEYILDASALLAVFQKEAGSDIIIKLKGSRAMSAVNIAEVRTRLVDWGCDELHINELIGMADIDIISFDAKQASLSSNLRPATKSKGLSLGDRACLALALHRQAPVFTADQNWAQIDVPADIRLIR
jgi:ribonuclease VapC